MQCQQNGSIRCTYSPAPTTLVDLVQWQAGRRSEETAYLFLQDGETETDRLSFATLERKARRIAVVLQQADVPGTPVALCYPPGLEYISGFFGCLYAGAIAVPAYPPNPKRADRTIPRLRAILQNSEASVVLTSSLEVSRVKEHLPRISGEALNYVATDTCTGDPTRWRQPDCRPDDPAILMYTSGSTGTPKGAIITHSNVLHNLRGFPGFRERPCSTIVSWLPFYHDLGLLLGILHPLNQGVPAVLMPPVAFVQRPIRWLRAMSAYDASTSGAPNFGYDLCVRKVTFQERGQLDLSAWNLALNGAEPVRAETLDRFTTAFEPAGFRREAFYPSYGMSENTATVTGPTSLSPPVYVSLDADALAEGHVKPVPAQDEDTQTFVGCGATLPSQEIAIVDPETRTRCAADEIGEIWISGPCVAEGYWNAPARTQQSLQATLRDDDDRSYLRTGDLGFLRDGQLFITGRIKDLIIIRGRNHYPQDIEQTVDAAHSLIRPGCSAAFTNQDDGNRSLVVVAEAAAPADKRTSIVDAIRQAVVDQHGINPTHIALLRPRTIPKTSSGKIQRHACRARFEAGTLDTIIEDGP